MKISRVTDVLEKFHQEECAFWIGCAKAKILIITAKSLVIQVNMEQFTRVPGLRDRVGKIQAGHMFMRDFRIYPYHLRMIQRLNKAQHGPGGRQVNIAARLVWFGLQRELQIIPLGNHILAEEIQRLTEPLQTINRIFPGVRLRPFPSAPKDIDPSSQFNPQVNRVHGFLQGISPHLRIIGCKGAIFEGRISKEVGRCHRDDQTGFIQSPFEIAYDLIALGWGGVNGDQIVVMKVNAICPYIGEQMNNFDRRKGRADRFPKWIPANITDCP